MLAKINDLPGHVLGIRASGEITARDMKNVLLPAMDEHTRRTGAFNYLLVLDTDVKDFTAAAWWQDMIAGLKHFTDWNRIAVVTDQKAVEIFTDLFELGVPGQSKGFKHDQLAEAIGWVSHSESSSLGRKVLGAGLILAGIGHLTFARKEFQAQVPDWVPLTKDDTVVYSGLAEIALGSALLITPKAGKVAAGFFAAVFPGNIAQYTQQRNAFGLDTDGKRLARLFFQPLLIYWALKSSK